MVVTLAVLLVINITNITRSVSSKWSEPIIQASITKVPWGKTITELFIFAAKTSHSPKDHFTCLLNTIFLIFNF